MVQGIFAVQVIFRMQDVFIMQGIITVQRIFWCRYLHSPGHLHIQIIFTVYVIYCNTWYLHRARYLHSAGFDTKGERERRQGRLLLMDEKNHR